MIGEGYIAETVLTVFGSGFAGWFFSRRLYKKQVEAAHLQNEVTAVEIWKTLAIDLKAENTELRQEIKQMRAELDELKRNWKQEHESQD